MKTAIQIRCMDADRKRWQEASGEKNFSRFVREILDDFVDGKLVYASEINLASASKVLEEAKPLVVAAWKDTSVLRSELLPEAKLAVTPPRPAKPTTTKGGFCSKTGFDRKVCLCPACKLIH